MYNSLQNRQNNSRNCGEKFLCFLIACSFIGSIFCFVRSQQIPDQIKAISYASSCYKFCDGYTFDYNSYCCKDYGGFNCLSKQWCRSNLISQLNNDHTIFQNLAGFFVIILFVFSICFCCIKTGKRKNRIPPMYNALANQAQNQMHNQVNIGQQSTGVKKRKIEENYESFAVESEETCCAVCMMEFTGEKAIILKCGHIFHSKCIRDWAAKQENCPVCRASH